MSVRVAAQKLISKGAAGILSTSVRPQAPTTTEEMHILSRKLGKPIPVEVLSLLELTSGLVIDSLGRIDFLGSYTFEFREVFPLSVPILSDGCGNFWVVDVDPQSGSWGPVFFACHDPLAIVLQSGSLSDFIEQLLEAYTPGGENSLERVQRIAARGLASEPDEAITVMEARQSNDQAVRSFAGELSDSFMIVDLRALKTGSGVKLWRAGFEAEVVRFRNEFLWGVRFVKEEGQFGNLFWGRG